MKVSIILATYNRGYIIRDAIASALNQSFGDFEIIVVDDGSSDDTREVVENVMSDKIRYISHDYNRGYSAACNTGINSARSPLLAFLDSDDVWKPDYLERQVSFLSRHPETDVVFCDTEIQHQFTTDLSLIARLRVFPRLLQDNPSAIEHLFDSRQMYLCLLEEVPIKPTAVVLRREVFEQVGLFDEAWPSGTDWDFFLRLSRVASFGYINLALAVQRRTVDATHQKYQKKDKLFVLSIFLREKATLAGDEEALRTVNRGLLDQYNALGWIHLESGNRREARSVYWRAFKETFQPIMLMKLVSTVIPVAIRKMLKKTLKSQLTVRCEKT